MQEAVISSDTEEMPVSEHLSSPDMSYMTVGCVFNGNESATYFKQGVSLKGKAL